VLTLKKLDVGIERLSFKDARSPEGKLLAASVRLTNREPIEALGEDVESNRPVLLDVEGKLEPFVRAFGVALETSPFAKEPELKVDVKSEGIQGTEITEVLPDLRELLDGKELTDGRFQAKLESTLRLRRRSPLSFDLSRGFGVQLLVQGVKFQNGEEGPVLLGVDEVVVDVDRFEPKTGEVKVKEIDVQRPIARIQRTPEGIEALGLLVRIPKAAEKPAGEASAPPAAESVPPVETSAAPAPAVLPASVPAAGAPPAAASRSDLWPAAAEPPAEISIDRLTMGGLDFRFEDTSLSPPVHVFLNGLDVDVRGATNRMLVEPRTVRFRASVQSGKVNLPAVDKTGVLSGAISDASAVMSGEKVDTTRKTEERELFEDAGVNGKIGLFPRPKGYLLTRLRGFDLSGVKSYAAQAGVVVDSGLIDNATRITLPGDDSLAVDTTVRLESLDISEPPAGPIFRYAHLPAPLHTVIFVLRDEDERISLSLSPQLSSISHLSTPEIVGQAGEQALSALSQLILNALKAAPMRAVMGFVPAGEEEPKVEESIVLSFEPGDAHLTAAEAAKLEPLMQRLKDGDSLTITLVHSFGALDIERSTLRGNPSPEECVELGLRLRREKELLLKKRQEVAAQARSAVLSGIYQESPALLKSLRAIDRDITAADSALEVVYNLLRPGAENGAPRRTRNNALALAKSRVSEIRENLVATGAPEIENALRASRPDYDGKGTEGPGTVTLLITPRRK